MATKRKASGKGKNPGGEALKEDLAVRRVLVPGDVLIMQGEVRIPSPVIGAPDKLLVAGSMGLVVRCSGEGDCDIVFSYGGGLLTASGVTDEMLGSCGAVMVWDGVRSVLLAGKPTEGEAGA